MEVLGWLALGLSDKQLARQLEISDLTARTYRTRLLQKSGAHNICALLYQAYSQGWIPFPEHDPGESGAIAGR
jgi:DNA-binding NarL/FixJ family response regulator